MAQLQSGEDRNVRIVDRLDVCTAGTESEGNVPKRRHLKSAAPQARDTAVSIVHDCSATELPKDAIVAPIEVDDPLERGARIRVVASLRGDPLRSMWARHQIDDAKLAAGRRWQSLYEQAELSTLRSIDFARERVDGSGHSPEILTDRRARAMATLRGCRDELGAVGDALVRDVIGRGLCLAEVAASRGLTSTRHLNYLGGRFRECLESLAKTFGYA
jgi:hypothetical protein